MHLKKYFFCFHGGPGPRSSPFLYPNPGTVHRLCSYVCLFMCSYIDTSDTYWPGAMYQALCWPLRRGQGAEQAWVLFSGVYSLFVWDKWRRRGAWWSGTSLAVTLQRIRPGLQRNQSNPHKPTPSGTVTWAMSRSEGSVSIHLYISLVVRHFSWPLPLQTYLGGLCCYAEFRDPHASKRLVCSCIIKVESLDKTGLDECECWVWRVYLYQGSRSRLVVSGERITEKIPCLRWPWIGRGYISWK